MKALRIGSACFAACLATCILGAGPAMAFSVSLTDSSAVARWPTSVVTYYLQALGSDDLTPQASVETVRKAFQSWRPGRVVAEGGGGVTPSTAVHVLHLNADLSQIADPIRLNGDTPGSGDCLEHVAAAWGDEALGVAWVEGCQGLRTLRFSQVRVVRGDTEGL